MIEYPPPYEHFLWDCKGANVSAINAPLNQVDWDFFFESKF